MIFHPDASRSYWWVCYAKKNCQSVLNLRTSGLEYFRGKGIDKDEKYTLLSDNEKVKDFNVRNFLHRKIFMSNTMYEMQYANLFIPNQGIFFNEGLAHMLGWFLTCVMDELREAFDLFFTMNGFFGSLTLNHLIILTSSTFNIKFSGRFFGLYWRKTFRFLFDKYQKPNNFFQFFVLNYFLPKFGAVFGLYKTSGYFLSTNDFYNFKILIAHLRSQKRPLLDNRDQLECCKLLLGLV